MRTHLRFFGVTATVLGLGLWFVATAGKAADEKDQLRESVLKLADTLKDNKADDAKKQAAAIADKIDDVEELMHLMSPRRPKGKGPGIGIGNKPGAIAPDGIEQKIQALAKKPLLAAQLGKESEALERMAYIAAAIGQVANAKPPDKDDGKKKKKDWLTWSQEMHDAALELAAAVKKKDAAAIKTASGKVDAKCTSCHDVFKCK